MTVNGYEIIGELSNDNSGYAKWGFARKGMYEQVFIKQFLSPVYPSEASGLSPKQMESKIKICKDFEYSKRVFYNRLNRCITGNIVTINDFFRSGNKYYMVTEKVNAEKLQPEVISKMSLEQKMLIIKVLLYNVASLHNAGIVHGDLKPNNILFQKTAANVYTSKLIDFDSSFLEENPPKDESDLQGDMVYFAPESFLFVAEEEGEVTCKIDVFALGIIIHQYFCGNLPYFDREKYNYTFEAALDGAPITIDASIPQVVRNLISQMLCTDPNERPSCAKVFKEIMSVYGPKEARNVKSVVNAEETERTNARTRSIRPGEYTGGTYGGSVAKPAGSTTKSSGVYSGGDFFKKVSKL